MKCLRFRYLILLLAAGSTPIGATELLVSAADFHATSPEGHIFSSSGGWIEGQLSPGAPCLVAGVDLPDGARLTSLLFHLYDNRGGENFRVDLRRKRRGNSVAAETLLGASTSGSSTGVQEFLKVFPQPGHLVDDTHIYFLTTNADCLDGVDHRIHSVRVNFVEPIFADGFESGDTSAWNGLPPPESVWVGGADFLSAFSNGWPWVFDPSLGTFSMFSDSSSIPCGIAPVELPQGATVVALVANLWDVRNDLGLTVSLRRSPMFSGVVPAVMASASSSGSTGWQIRTDFSISNALIENQSYWYYLDVCMTGGTTASSIELRTQAVELVYTLP